MRQTDNIGSKNIYNVNGCNSDDADDKICNVMKEWEAWLC